MLNAIALFVIFFLIVMIAAAIVALGSLPGKIARKRGHPWPDAVNAASWIGLATGVFWPVAFIWAFLPVPCAAGASPASPSGPPADAAKLQERVTALETALKELQSREKGGA